MMCIPATDFLPGEVILENLFQSSGDCGPCMTTAPFMALTASAPPEIEVTIISSLHLKEPVAVTWQLDRPNIYLSICKSVGLKVSSYAVGQLCCL